MQANISEAEWRRRVCAPFPVHISSSSNRNLKNKLLAHDGENVRNSKAFCGINPHTRHESSRQEIFHSWTRFSPGLRIFPLVGELCDEQSWAFLSDFNALPRAEICSSWLHGGSQEKILTAQLTAEKRRTVWPSWTSETHSGNKICFHWDSRALDCTAGPWEAVTALGGFNALPSDCWVQLGQQQACALQAESLLNQVGVNQFQLRATQSYNLWLAASKCMFQIRQQGIMQSKASADPLLRHRAWSGLRKGRAWLQNQAAGPHMKAELPDASEMPSAVTEVLRQGAKLGLKEDLFWFFLVL